MAKKNLGVMNLRLDEETLDWLGNNGYFTGKSETIRKCIQIARRVLDTDDSEDLRKYVFPKK